MADKSNLHVGDKVSGLRAFDKSHRVEGTIWQILNGPYIDVQLENGTIESMHVDDVRVLEAAKAAPTLDLADPEVREAVEYVMSRGYEKDAAESIVLEHGVATILNSKAEDAAEKQRKAEEEAKRKAEEEAEAKAAAEAEKPKADAA